MYTWLVMKRTMRDTMTQRKLSDAQLEKRLVEAYIFQDESDEINRLKTTLYERGYGWSDIVELALASLVRRDQIAQGGDFSLN